MMSPWGRARGDQEALRRVAPAARIVGCSTHYVTGELDGGPIILQAALPVKSGQSVVDLQRRVLRLEHLVLPRTVQLIAEGRVSVADGMAKSAPGPSWIEQGPEPVAGALYSEGY
jgi:phosphoribosylglycinamide formyltransferase-1